MSTERGAAGVTPIAMQFIDSTGAIVYNGSSSNANRPLMIGFRGGAETFSNEDMFLANTPVIATWSYNGGAKADINSFGFTRNPDASGQAPATFADTLWGPLGQHTCCIGGANTNSLIGRENGSGPNQLDWAAVLIYDKVLTDQEMTQVVSFLGNEYGIPAVPEPHSLLLMMLGGIFMLPLSRRCRRNR